MSRNEGRELDLTDSGNCKKRLEAWAGIKPAHAVRDDEAN